MKRFSLLSALLLTAMLSTSCVGSRTADGLYTVHAESLRLFGFAIPGDDQAAAAKYQAEKYPGSTVTESSSTPADWISFWGILGNIIGLHRTEISGQTK